jgi:transcriptional regulator GlxA family with amidase domain
MSRPASGRSKVRLIQALPGDQVVDLASGGDVLFSGAKFPSASGYQDVQAGRAELEVREAGGGKVLAPARTVNLPKGTVSSLVVVGGIGEKVELLDIRDSVASAVAPAGGVATGVGGTASSGGRRFAVLFLIAIGIVALVGFVLAQQRSSG